MSPDIMAQRFWIWDAPIIDTHLKIADQENYGSLKTCCYYYGRDIDLASDRLFNNCPVFRLSRRDATSAPKSVAATNCSRDEAFLHKN